MPDTRTDVRVERSRAHPCRGATHPAADAGIRATSRSRRCAPRPAAKVGPPSTSTSRTSTTWRSPASRSASPVCVPSCLLRTRCRATDRRPHEGLRWSFLEELAGERASWQRTIGSGTTFSATRDAVETWLVDRLTERTPEAGSAALRYAAAGFLGGGPGLAAPGRRPRPAGSCRAGGEPGGRVRALCSPPVAAYAGVMKTRLSCPCGEVIKAKDEDELVERPQQHLAAAHPGMTYGRDEILFIAT